MANVLVVDYEKCTGCRMCELVCSINKEGSANPAHARIHVNKWEMEGFYAPVFCRQCAEPTCAAVCPVNAISRDNDRDLTAVDDALCIGCRACISACAFGGVGFNQETQRTMRCDTCNGDPTCVQFCETGALQFLDVETVNLKRQRRSAEKFRTAAA
jgi:Fe-S-cluster-containing hydrogenase component 2